MRPPALIFPLLLALPLQAQFWSELANPKVDLRLVHPPRLGLHLARAGAIWYRDLGGLEVAFDFPIAPILACWGILVAMTLGAAMPAVLSLARRPVRELLA